MRKNSTSSPSWGASRRRAAAELWSRYRGNLARHLIGVSRDLEKRVVQSLSVEEGYRGLRPSFAPFLSLIPSEGRPLRSIAEELAISPQACSQLANLVEEAGYLTRKPNVRDRRSKLVSLTPRGRALVEAGVRLILESEAEYKVLAGASTYRGFRFALAKIFEGMGLSSQTEASLSARARRSVGVLPLIAVRIQRELMQATIARGHEGLKMSHGQVLPLIGAGGGRIFEIARVQGVSRQAISIISKDLESLGYLRREPDSRDRRGVVLKLTSRGEELIGDSVAALDGLEASFRAVLGDTGLEDLRMGASSLYQSLHLEEEVFEASAIERVAFNGSTPVAASEARRGGDELRELASRLREQLGRGDAARLAALLGPETRRTMS